MTPSDFQRRFTFSNGGFMGSGVTVSRVGSSGPHLHFAARSVPHPATSLSFRANTTPYLDALQAAMMQAGSVYAAPPSLLGIDDDPPDDEQAKRDQALDKVRNRNTGPARNPFRRRRSQR